MSKPLASPRLVLIVVSYMEAHVPYVQPSNKSGWLHDRFLPTLTHREIPHQGPHREVSMAYQGPHLAYGPVSKLTRRRHCEPDALGGWKMSILDQAIIRDLDEDKTKGKLLTRNNFTLQTEINAACQNG